MRPAPAIVMAAAAFAAWPSVARAEPIKATVVSVSGSSVYLNQGRSAGVAAGARVRVQIAGGAVVDAVVAAVTASSSRVDLPEGAARPPVGSAAEVNIPETAAPPEAPEEARPAPPPHPPWTLQEGPRDPDAPLLAPAFGKPARERPTTLHGRAFTQFQYSIDRGGGRDNSYLLARAGSSLDVTNPFGQGGTFSFSGEVDLRKYIADLSSQSEAQFIFDTLSYTIGDEQYSPFRLEAGRFYSSFLPAIGTVDGAEGVVRFESGLSLGLGVGVFPLPYPNRDWGSEYGFYVFLDYHDPKDETFFATVGFQKSWHEGAADRDAILAKFNLMPSRDLSVFGSCTLDIYGSSEAVRDPGVVLTEAWLQARYSITSGSGVSVAYSRYTWADTKEWDFDFVPVELISDGIVDRLDSNVWVSVLDNVRLNGRVYYYQDHRGDGTGGEFGVDVTSPFEAPLSLYGAVFHTAGSYTSGNGFRVELRPGTGDVQAFIGYELFSYTDTGQIGTDSSLRQTIRGGVGWQAGQWYYNLSIDHYFGDSEDAYSIAAFVQYQF